MGIERINFKEIPSSVRQVTAQQYREQLRQTLRDPFLSDEKRASIEEKLRAVGTWATAT